MSKFSKYLAKGYVKDEKGNAVLLCRCEGVVKNGIDRTAMVIRQNTILQNCDKIILHCAEI